MPIGINGTVFEIGINDMPGMTEINGKRAGFYNTWKGMLRRCYSAKYQDGHPTYRGRSVCDEWLTLSNFKVWHDANYHAGWALDKDIMIEGSKVYSPETCKFVPGYINSVILDAGAARGDLPMGVRHVNSAINPYRAHCKDGHDHYIHGTCRSTVAEAKADYARLKTEVVRKQAKKAAAEGMGLDVYYALIARKWY